MLPLIQEFINYQKDRCFVQKQYKSVFHRQINWRHPVTYNEKLNVDKISPQFEKLWPYVDKWRVRKFVAKKLGRQILNQVYGVYRDPESIDLESLPNQFVLKATHGSSWNIICKKKADLDWPAVKQQLKTWLKTNYYSLFRERQYKLIPPQIMCEKYLEDNQGQLTDYKFFCFHGQPRFIQVDINRFSNHRRNHYTLDWQKLPFSQIYPTTYKKIPRPTNLAKMITIAETLSAGFPHVKVDLYNVKRKVYFGELTLTHTSGLHPFKPMKYDYIFGQYF